MLPDNGDLAAELISVEFGYKPVSGVDSILLEKKADMKKRGLASPDMADALALTFAYPVIPSDHTPQFTNKPQHQADYNPLGREHLSRSGPGTTSQHQIEYNPFGRR